MSITDALECDECGTLLAISSPDYAAEVATASGWEFDETTHHTLCEDCKE